MSKRLLPLVPADLVVEQVLPTPYHLTVVCRSSIAAPLCPGCGYPSSRRHSSYPRRLADLPWQGRRVQIEVQVRRFRCGRPGCAHRIFAERLPAAARPHAQRTARRGGLQRHIGLALGGKAGARLAAACQAAGFQAFRLKLGFGPERDQANLAELCDALGGGAVLMADVNQGWTLDEAQAAAPWLLPFRLEWLKKPLRANRPWAEWQALAEAGIPLAARENLAGEAFAAAIGSGALAVLQPDAGNWVSISGTLPLARGIVAAGLRYSPHWLGGGVGLLASAHLLGAAGGPGSVIAHPGWVAPLWGEVVANAWRRSRSTERPLALAVLTTERKAA